MKFAFNESWGRESKERERKKWRSDIFEILHTMYKWEVTEKKLVNRLSEFERRIWFRISWMPDFFCHREYALLPSLYQSPFWFIEQKSRILKHAFGSCICIMPFKHKLAESKKNMKIKYVNCSVQPQQIHMYCLCIESATEKISIHFSFIVPRKT